MPDPDLQIRPMRAAEREPVLDLLGAAFGERALFARYMDLDPAFDWGDFTLALDAGRPVACVQLFAKRVRVRGRALDLGGIGSVATAQTHRQRGLATRLLRCALDQMRARGMALSLLFAGPHPLYQALGWVRIPGRRGRLSAGPGTPATTRSRTLSADVLPAVRALYAEYTRTLEACTVRDARYWRGQLGYAGTPCEDFRVVPAPSGVAAYARAAEFPDGPAVLEFARAPDAAAALAELLLELARERPHHVPRVRDLELDAALAARGARLAPDPDDSPMWRVVDRDVLRGLLAADEPADDDAALLRALVGGPRAVYWPSDRF